MKNAEWLRNHKRTWIDADQLRSRHQMHFERRKEIIGKEYEQQILHKACTQGEIRDLTLSLLF